MELTNGVLVFRVGSGAHECLVMCDMRGGHPMPEVAPPPDRAWRLLLSSEEKRFGGEGEAAFTVPATFVLPLRVNLRARE